MEFYNLYLLSTYLKKWSFPDNRISLNYSFSLGDIYERNHIDMRLGSPTNMVNELLNHIFHRAKEILQEKEELEESGEDLSSNIILVNESEVKRKVSVFLAKILKEFNLLRRTRGRQRMISTRSLDFYYNDFEYEPLDDDIKFFVHLNRGSNKMSGDLWTNAIDDLRLALDFKPDDIRANRYMATALSKLGRFGDALPHIKVYAEAENTPDSLQALARAYINLENFEKAEQVYKQIEENFPDSLLASFGKALIAYKLGKGYKTILDRIYKRDPEWLQEKLKTDWEYKLPGYGDDEDAMWNAATAARYLGLERPFDLTKRAFNDEIPSYFDSEKGTIRFVKAELDAWVELNNRYKLSDETFEVHEDRLTDAEKRKMQKKRKRKKTAPAVEAEPAI